MQQAKPFSKQAAKAAVATYTALKERQAWGLAISLAKAFPVQVFMFYMSSGGVQIFNMGIAHVVQAHCGGEFRCVAVLDER